MIQIDIKRNRIDSDKLCDMVRAYINDHYEEYCGGIILVMSSETIRELEAESNNALIFNNDIKIKYFMGCRLAYDDSLEFGKVLIAG